MEHIGTSTIQFNGGTSIPTKVFKHLKVPTPQDGLGKGYEMQWYKQGKKIIVKIEKSKDSK